MLKHKVKYNLMAKIRGGGEKRVIAIKNYEL